MGDGTGVYNSEMNIDRVKYRGKRSYAANTYYDISVNRPNLEVFVGTQVSFCYLGSPLTKPNCPQAIKVNFVPHSVGTMRATSVSVTAVNHTGITGIMHARKEVVLAAGTKLCVLMYAAFTKWIEQDLFRRRSCSSFPVCLEPYSYSPLLM